MSRLAEVVAMMATDPQFASQVRRDPGPVATQYGLTPDEAAQLAALADADESAGPAQLGARLSKSSIGSGGLSSLMQGLSAPTATDVVSPTSIHADSALPGVALPLDVQPAPVSSLLPATVDIVGPDLPDPDGDAAVVAPTLATPIDLKQPITSLLPTVEDTEAPTPTDGATAPTEVKPVSIIGSETLDPVKDGIVGPDEPTELDKDGVTPIAVEVTPELKVTSLLPPIDKEPDVDPTADLEAAVDPAKESDGEATPEPSTPVATVLEEPSTPGVTAPEESVPAPAEAPVADAPTDESPVAEAPADETPVTESLPAETQPAELVVHGVDSRGNAITTTYHADGSYTEVTDGSRDTREFDAAGHLTSSTYQDRGFLPTTRTVSVHCENHYGPDGRLTVRNYSWDDSAGHHEMTWPNTGASNEMQDVVVRSDGTRVETTYEWNNGNPYASRQVIETLGGSRTEMTFDASGTATGVNSTMSDSALVTHNPDGTMTVDNTAPDGTRRVGIYDADGHLLRETAYGPDGDTGVTVHNPDGTVTHTGVFHSTDRFGNHIVTRYADDGSYTQTDPFRGVKHFDATGRLTSSSYYDRGLLPTSRGLNVLGEVTYRSNGSIDTRVFTWDDATGHHSMSWPPGDQMTDTITQPDGTRIQTTYSWNNGAPYATHQTIDTPVGGHTEMSFDSLGTRTDYVTTDTTHVTRNADGTITVDDTSLDGNRHVGTHDASGRLVRETVYAPNGDVGQAVYNADGTVTHTGTFHSVDRVGNMITTSYGADGSHTETDPFGGTRHFDAAGHITSYDFSDRPPLPTGTAGSAAVHFTYNPDGSIAGRTYTWDDATGHHSVSWPPGGTLTDTVTRLDGTRVETTYLWNNGAPYSTATRAL